MGRSRMEPADWSAYAATNTQKTRTQIFTSTSVPEDLDPAKFILKRESRDSVANPHSTPIIVGADVTGSMGSIAETLVRKGIGVAFEEILTRAKKHNGTMITDPHLMVMGIGDMDCDSGPVQATQFESDLAIAKQLERIWLEGGGGNNNHESYDTAWYMAARLTTTDSMEKRHKKGYLFTVGDEEIPTGITKLQARRFFGTEEMYDLSAQDLLALAEESYNVFHIIVEEGNYAQRMGIKRVQDSWTKLLGRHVLTLNDHNKLAEIIVSAIQVNEGASVSSIVNTWSGNTALTVSKALKNFSPTVNVGSGELVTW